MTHNKESRKKESDKNMQTVQPQSKFAPPERLGKPEIQRQSHLILDQAFLSRLYEAVMNAVVILNQQRQIVYCNRNFARFAGFSRPEEAYGMRPGEAIGCVHADEEEGGCGTAAACAFCGAVKTILDAQHGVFHVREANIRTNGGGPDVNIEMKASIMQFRQESFVIVSINDISDRVRRRALERVFFHDLMNTASGLKIISEELPDAAADPGNAIKEQLLDGISHLMEEIREQRSLLAAETEELQLTVKPARSTTLLKELTAYYQYFDIATGKNIVFSAETEDITFVTDRTLVFRVIGNMLKNALEASAPGETVTIDCRRKDGGIEFSVRNPAFMPQDVQFQVFNRSFSTKARGRGLGTYSMKLLTEHYLSGRLFFTSSRRAGTCFRAWYPINLESALQTETQTLQEKP